ncbi:MAG: membrane-bound lytic murein transglycosylase MltF [Bdellovibrionales bacterium]
MKKILAGFFILFLFLFLFLEKKVVLDNSFTVVTKFSETTYFLDRDAEPQGFEYELLKDYTSKLNKELKIITVDSASELFTAIESGRADMIAAGVTRTPERGNRFVFGPVYGVTNEVLVCNKAKISTNSSWNTKLIRDSSYQRNWENKLRDSDFIVDLISSTTEEALIYVNDHPGTCTVADQHILNIMSRYLVNLSIKEKSKISQELSWVFPKNSNVNFSRLNKWFSDYTRSGDLERLYEKHFGHIKRKFNPFESQIIIASFRERFPQYKKYFIESAEKNQLDWRLLAAVSYQESHWKKDAVSPTGVRGLLMLTRKTAKLLGVNRNIPEQSIEGGARYLRRLYNQLPADIKAPDRMWVTLASYNVGLGHVLDVRQIIRDKGGDPSSWREIRRYLPLLTQPKYYRKTRFGYARGYEPVQYVKNIRSFYDILKKLDES